MKLTPLDIRHKEFHRGMRGYVDTEVDEFLDMAADELERVFKENLDLNERLRALQQQMEHYRGIEVTLQKTLLSAQQSADDLRAAAHKEAQLVLRDAEVKARDTLGEAYAARQQVEREIVLLKNAEADYRFKFRALLEGYLKQLTVTEGGARERASQFEQQAQALREAIVAGGGAGRPAGTDATAAGRPAAPPPATGPATPPPQSPAPAAPVSVAPPADVPPDRPQQQQAAAPPPPASMPAPAPAPAASSTPADEDGEDTAVIAGIDQTVDVRPLTEEEDDFFSNVDDGARDNEFKW